MKFLTWNIQSGGGKRVHAILRELEVLNPEFIALTEVTATNQLTLEQALVARNYPYVAAIHPPTNKNSVLVASRMPFQVSEDVITNDSERWLSVEITDKNLRVLSVHIPGSDDNAFGADGYGISGEKRKEIFWGEVLKYAEKCGQRRAVLLGDFNTGLKEDAEGTPFKLSECITKLRNIGFIDAWRHLNPGATDYTYYSRRRNKQEGSSQNHNGFRLDYVFVSPSLRDGIISARHVHHVREQKLSDHSIVLSELDV